MRAVSAGQLHLSQKNIFILWKASSYNPVIEEWPLHPSFSPSGVWPWGRCDISWPPCCGVGGWHKRAHVCGIQRLAVLSCLIHQESPRKHLKGHWSRSATFKQKVGPMRWLPPSHGCFCVCILRMFVVEFTYNFCFSQLIWAIIRHYVTIDWCVNTEAKTISVLAEKSSMGPAVMRTVSHTQQRLFVFPLP